jgi:hypothetical protein
MGSAEHIRTPTSNSAVEHWLILATVTFATGLAAGLGGMVLGLLLHFIQHVAYGYSLHAIVSHESFLGGVSASSPVRRFRGALCLRGGSGNRLVGTISIRQPFGFHPQGGRRQKFPHAVFHYDWARPSSDRHSGPGFTPPS